MKFRPSEPGVIVSAVGHAALLVATLAVFSDAPQFKEAEESVPVEVVTNEQFNQIMRGEKTAKEVKPTPPRAPPAAGAHKRTHAQRPPSAQSAAQ